MENVAGFVGALNGLPIVMMRPVDIAGIVVDDAERAMNDPVFTDRSCRQYV